MSFLPFVISFLLILVVGGSLMLQSFRSTAVEKTIILSRNQAHLNLRSEQAHKEFKALQAKAKKQENNSKVPQQTVSTQKEAKAKEFVQKRNLRQNIDSSKLNLWPLIHEPDSVASKVLYKKVIKLIEMLYGETDFYKSTHNPGLATALIDQMLGKNRTLFSSFFPKILRYQPCTIRCLEGQTPAILDSKNIFC